MLFATTSRVSSSSLSCDLGECFSSWPWWWWWWWWWWCGDWWCASGWNAYIVWGVILDYTRVYRRPGKTSANCERANNKGTRAKIERQYYMDRYRWLNLVPTWWQKLLASRNQPTTNRRTDEKKGIRNSDFRYLQQRAGNTKIQIQAYSYGHVKYKLAYMYNSNYRPTYLARWKIQATRRTKTKLIIELFQQRGYRAPCTVQIIRGLPKSNP